jgi:hypothetical protein
MSEPRYWVKMATAPEEPGGKWGIVDVSVGVIAWYDGVGEAIDAAQVLNTLVPLSRRLGDH